MYCFPAKEGTPLQGGSIGSWGSNTLPRRDAICKGKYAQSSPQETGRPQGTIFHAHNRMSSQSKTEQASRLHACLLFSETSAWELRLLKQLVTQLIQTQFPSPGNSSHLSLSCVDLILFHSCNLSFSSLPWTSQGRGPLPWLGCGRQGGGAG